MSFSNHNNKKPSDIRIIIHDCDNNSYNSCNCNSLSYVNKAKYLGIIIDSNMKWKEHVLQIKKRTRYLIYVIASLKKILDQKMLLIIYYALFESVAFYGILAWGGFFKTENKKKIQNYNLYKIN